MSAYSLRRQSHLDPTMFSGKIIPPEGIDSGGGPASEG